MIRDVMVKFKPGEFIAYNSQSVEVKKKNSRPVGG